MIFLNTNIWLCPLCIVACLFSSILTSVLFRPILMESVWKMLHSTHTMGALRHDDVLLFVCSFVCLSPVKFVKSFAAWQHLTASRGLLCRLRYTCC